MLLPIYLYGQPVLRKVAENVPADYPELPKLAENMFATMDKASGVGLAAPQVGLALRMFVVDGDALSEDYPECSGFRRCMVNPEMIEESEETDTKDEGCLSIPGIYEPVKRPTWIVMKYLDENLVEHQERIEGFAARMTLHEYDHLDGKMFIEHVSPIRISRDYQNMFTQLQKDKHTKADKEAVRFLKEKIESGRNFIDAIRQRNETLLNTMRAIAFFQKDYFLMGDDCYLKPMILEDIAKITGTDPSTISRVSNSKYVQTDFGIIPLKHFFSESLKNMDGEDISTKEIKKQLRSIVDQEDKMHPYTDDQLVEKLQELGYSIARRTIAKYRDQLNIPITGQRKRLKNT